jgi:hypothetical protein
MSYVVAIFLALLIGGSLVTMLAICVVIGLLVSTLGFR